MRIRSRAHHVILEKRGKLGKKRKIKRNKKKEEFQEKRRSNFVRIMGRVCFYEFHEIDVVLS